MPRRIPPVIPTLPDIIANVLTDHNLANHPLAIIPTMDDGHIPDLDVAKITSGRFGMARMPAGTATHILTAQGAGVDPAYAAPPAADVGGLYGFNLETLSAAKTLTVGTDEIYQYLNPGVSNRVITLDTASASAGDRWVIRHNGAYGDNTYLDVKEGATTIDQIYAGGIKGYIYDGSNWVAERIGSGEQDSKRGNIAIGYQARSRIDGVAIGHSARGDSDGLGIGWGALGYTSGVALGNAAYGYNYGVGVGGSAQGHNYGVSIGNSSRSGNKRYSVALGYYSRCLRTSETITNIDGSTNYKNQAGQARWSGQTTDATPTELLLGNMAAQRFSSRYKEAVAFTGLVVATDEYTAGPHHDTKAWKVEGLIKSTSGGTYVSVAITHEVIGNDAGAAAWDAVFSVSGTNLILTVTGAAGVTIRWAAKIDFVEVVW